MMRALALALAAGLAAGTASAQTTATGEPVAGAPIAGSGTPRAGSAIRSNDETAPRGAGQAGAGREAGGVAPAARPGQVSNGELIGPGRPAGGVAPAAVVAPVQRAGSPGASGAVNDGLFAAAAAGLGLSEVACARIAAERGGCDEVKKFAQHMIDDHSKANAEMMGLAAQRRMPLPNALPVTAQAEENILMGLSGDEFDKCYVKQQIAAHMCVIGLFKAESERGQDPQMRAWAASTLPKLKGHLAMVKAMHEKMESKEKGEPATHRD